MPKLDDKVLRIGTAITSQAETESRAIIDRANEIRDRELREYKDQVIDEMFGRVQSQSRATRQRILREKAVALSGAHRELLEHRETLSGRVFDAVRRRLAEYTQTEEYRAALLQRLAEAAKGLDAAACAVLLRPADLGLADEIEAALPGCRVEAAKRIKLGGFQLRSEAAGVLLDETLDARLEEQRGWYLMTCGLKTG